VVVSTNTKITDSCPSADITPALLLSWLLLLLWLSLSLFFCAIFSAHTSLCGRYIPNNKIQIGIKRRLISGYGFDFEVVSGFPHYTIVANVSKIRKYRISLKRGDPYDKSFSSKPTVRLCFHIHPVRYFRTSATK